MLILIDLDGTVAKRNTPRFIAKCNSYFDLGIQEQRLADFSWATFLEQPEVHAYRERVGEKGWQWKLRCVALDPAYQRQMLPMHDSVQAVQQLAGLGIVGYCTCRKTTFSDEWNAKMEQSTTDWLTNLGFPNPNNVTFCITPAEKLREAVALIERTHEPVLLIDDLAEQLIADAADLSASEQAVLAKYFTLCAFYSDVAPVSPFFRSVALRYWTNVDELFVNVGLVARI